MKKKVVYKDPPRRYYFNGTEVSKTQAQEIKSVGGNITTERNDDWFWRYWA